MTREKQERIDCEWLVLDAVGFDDRHVVTIDRNVEESIAGCIDNAKPVPLGLGNADNRSRCTLRRSDRAPLTIN